MGVGIVTTYNRYNTLPVHGANRLSIHTQHTITYQKRKYHEIENVSENGDQKIVS